MAYVELNNRKRYHGSSLIYNDDGGATVMCKIGLGANGITAPIAKRELREEYDGYLGEVGDDDEIVSRCFGYIPDFNSIEEDDDSIYIIFKKPDIDTIISDLYSKVVEIQNELVSNSINVTGIIQGTDSTFMTLIKSEL